MISRSGPVYDLVSTRTVETFTETSSNLDANSYKLLRICQSIRTLNSSL